MQYIEELYRGIDHGNNSWNDLVEIEEDDKGDTILRSDFGRTLKDFDDRVAPEIHKISAESLKSAGVNLVYTSLRVKFINQENYQLISRKVLLK